ncbi:hypothetical protein HPB50_007144 [Hyalomma asiaticum]|uniref:Uncharacterized protein n=1 Tax=Hyalomma asiaticum TaxID=266040 RepID=A0ACB7TJR4_HYAAI|nr:hypothetical protein HPB50_007144 [Hyalomma asiaticum]
MAQKKYTRSVFGILELKGPFAQNIVRRYWAPLTEVLDPNIVVPRIGQRARVTFIAMELMLLKARHRFVQMCCMAEAALLGAPVSRGNRIQTHFSLMAVNHRKQQMPKNHMSENQKAHRRRQLRTGVVFYWPASNDSARSLLQRRSVPAQLRGRVENVPDQAQKLRGGPFLLNCKLRTTSQDVVHNFGYRDTTEKENLVWAQGRIFRNQLL